MEIKINEKKLGRIDKVLVLLLKDYNFSRTYITKLIKNKNILVNDKIIFNNYHLKLNDKVTINFPKIKKLNIKAEDIDFKIVYEDDDIAVIDKPNNLVVHPSNGHINDTLVNGLLKKIKNLSNINGIIRPGIVHRIDKKTTGLLLVAKNNNAHKFLCNNIAKKVIKRYYKVIVKGFFKYDSATINAPIGRDQKFRKKMCVVPSGKEAITLVKLIENLNNHALLECELLTGRTHQIRVHLKYINHPVLGDNEYGNSKDPYGQYLHAYMLKIIHPTTKKEMIFISELPKEFQLKIKELSNKL